MIPKKRFSLIAGCIGAAALINSHAVFAADHGKEIEAIKKRLAELEQQIPAAASPVANGKHWFIQEDRMDWKLRNSKAEYGITDIGGVQDRGAVGTVLKVDDKENSADRFIIGVRFGINNASELSFTETKFNSSNNAEYSGSMRATFVSSDNSENDDSDNINTLGVETITPDDRATSASASFSFKYKNEDLKYLHTLTASEDFSVQLGGGVRKTIMSNAFDVTYRGGDFQTAFNSFENGSFKGQGLFFASAMDWNIVQNLGLKIGGQIGVVLGDVESRVFIPDDEPGVPTDVSYSDRRAVPFIDMALELNYFHDFGPLMLNTAIGYELTHWSDVIDSRVFTDSHMESQNVHTLGDISFDGTYVSIGLAF